MLLAVSDDIHFNLFKAVSQPRKNRELKRTYFIGDVNLTTKRAHRLHNRKNAVLCSSVQWCLSNDVDDVKRTLRVKKEKRDANLTAFDCEVQSRATALEGNNNTHQLTTSKHLHVAAW